MCICIYVYSYIYMYITVYIHPNRNHDPNPSNINPGLQVMFSWISFNATFPRENTVDEANVWYNRWQEFKAAGAGGGVVSF